MARLGLVLSSVRHKDSSHLRNLRCPIGFLTRLLATMLLAVLPPLAHAQTPPSPTAADQTGAQPFGSYSGGGFDRIDLTNGTVTIDYPILSYPQRGSLHLS